MPKHDKIDYPIPSIREWISQGDTQAQIAERLQRELDPRVTAKLIYKVCKKHGIKCQRTGPRSAEGHPQWKGGRILNKDGYVEIYTPVHPNARKHTHYILEHRLVMEAELGRFLEPSEVVHHKNGNKQDNRPENLEVFESNKKHLQETIKGQCPKWSPDGKKKLCEGAKAIGQRSIRLKTAIQTALGLDALPNNRKQSHYLTSHGLSVAEASKMVERREPLPFGPLLRPMRRHEKARQYRQLVGSF